MKTNLKFGELPAQGRYGYGITDEPKTVQYAASLKHAETEAKTLVLIYKREARVWDTEMNTVLTIISPDGTIVQTTAHPGIDWSY